MKYILLFAIPFLATLILNGFFSRRLNNRWGLRPNGMGFVFAASSLVAFAIAFAYQLAPIDEILVYMVAIVGMGMVGLINDTFKSDTPFYYRFRFKGLLKGDGQSRLVKGFIAFGIISLAGIPFSKNILSFLGNVLIMVLMTNCINLLNTGPGRATKAFIIFYLFIVLSPGYSFMSGLSIVMLGSVCAYASFDLKSSMYMGETGANILGAWLGVSAISGLDAFPKLLLFVILIALNVYGELWDISKAIENNVLLQAIDRWGRNRHG